MVEHQRLDGLRAELRPDGVGVITFDRPERLNPLTMQTLCDLERVLRQLGEDSACGAVVITGGDKAFCTGMDLKATDPTSTGGEPIEQVYAVMRRAVSSVLTMREIRQPVIAAVRGPAVGGGFAIATAADVRFCSPDAVFIAPFLKLGVSIGDMGLSWMLPRLIGAGAAAELFYSGSPLGAAEGQRLGLVQRIVDDPLQAAIELAATIAARPRLAVQMSKELLNASIGAGGLREHLELEMRSQVIGLTTEDHRQALRDFAARRRPDGP
ncbi:enoyl-CoA hydratase [Mycobacterium gordonae]|nr:enoyl-CoA hydratase/isomerase family protein [Mycobacterium gordonae]OBJ75672.1 enoyl-CoA hydratase [Mycobacterium gordonae]